MLMNKHSIELINQCLKELSNIEFQKRVWLNGEGPEVSNYTEAVCQLFDDTGLGDMLEIKQEDPVLSEDIDPIIIELGNVLDEIDYTLDTKDILNHSKWPTVTGLASKALKLLENL